MTIAVKVLNDQIKKISETNSLLDMLMEFEKFLDDLDIYSYKNWIEGEVLEGPSMSRNFCKVKLLYAEKDMPDPEGGLRLLNKDCLVKYTKDTLLSPIEVRDLSDITIETRPDGSIRKKAKTKSEPVWVVEIELPRKYVDEFMTDHVEIDDDTYIDTESLNSEDQIDAEQQQMGIQDGTES